MKTTMQQEVSVESPGWSWQANSCSQEHISRNFLCGLRITLAEYAAARIFLYRVLTVQRSPCRVAREAGSGERMGCAGTRPNHRLYAVFIALALSLTGTSAHDW